MSEANPMDEIVAKVAAGKCILFLGSAVHSAPPQGSKYLYPDSERPPIGSSLSRYLADKSGFLGDMPNEDVRNLQRVAQHFELKKERSKLAEELIAAVATGKRQWRSRSVNGHNLSLWICRSR